jgi:glycosyltransferase 2 family protein
VSRSVLEQEEEPAPRRPHRLGAIVRLAVGVGVIALLLWQTDLSSIRRALSTAEPLLIVAGFLLTVCLLIVSAFRWRVFLDALDIQLRPGTAVRLTLVGAFFNAFLPTGVGGDAYKAVRVREANAGLAGGFASVLLDRLSGIVALALMCILASIVAIVRSSTTALVLIGLAVSVGVLILGALLFIFGERLVGGGRRAWFGLRPRLRRMLEAAAGAIRDPSTVSRSLILALLGQAFAVAAYVSLAQSLDLGIAPGVIALGLLVATVAAAVPVTVNGLGIREAVWVWSLGLYEVGRGKALAYALVVLGVALATSALGGVIYALGGGAVTLRLAPAGRASTPMPESHAESEGGKNDQ